MGLLNLQERDDEGVQRERFHQRQTEEQRRKEPIRRVRVAPDRLHGGSRRPTLTERCAERRDTEAERCAEADEAAGQSAAVGRRSANAGLATTSSITSAPRIRPNFMGSSLSGRHVIFALPLLILYRSHVGGRPES